MYADMVRDRLRAALRRAIKDGDRNAVAALRSAIAGIDNAEAVEMGGLEAEPGAIGGARTGLGVAEVPRRHLSPAEVAALVRSEVDERLVAAESYTTLGRHERAERLRAEAAALVPYVPEPTEDGAG